MVELAWLQLQLDPPYRTSCADERLIAFVGVDFNDGLEYLRVLERFGVGVFELKDDCGSERQLMRVRNLCERWTRPYSNKVTCKDVASKYSKQY
jgi:hypothetical protein